ncbi:MAG: hypothetical protein KJ002_08480 [Candidatus Dadabacteria bacterium]|nr:hypothetical protein [Candidatus Dadabacteria bacterium]
MKKFILPSLFIAMAIFLSGDFAYSQAQPSGTEIQELKEMIKQLQLDNARRGEEIEQLKKENAEKIEALEKKVNELSGEKPVVVEKAVPGKPAAPAVPGEAAEEESLKAAEEEERDASEEDFFEMVNRGEKPYKKLVDEGPFKLTWGGYADRLFSWYGYGPDQTRPGGSGSDNRLEFDLTRFVLELEGEMFAGLGFEAEIEFEHGGTGSTFEIEYEEFGEYEQEIEKGGEVYVEELYLYKKFSDWGKLKAGRFYLAFGLMSFLSKPTDYLAARRPESETMVLPAVWDEMGVSFQYYATDSLNLTFQVVNGLDSTGFGSLNWIRGGHQGKFETIKATGLAMVGRIDYKFLATDYSWARRPTMASTRPPTGPRTTFPTSTRRYCFWTPTPYSTTEDGAEADSSYGAICGTPRRYPKETRGSRTIWTFRERPFPIMLFPLGPSSATT